MAWMRKENGPVPMPALPQAPQLPQPPLSQVWADSVARVEALENELEQSRQYAQEMLNRAKVAEGISEELRDELLHVRNNADYFTGRYRSVRAKLEAARLIIEDTLRDDTEQKAPSVVAPDVASESGLGGVGRELASEIEKAPEPEK